MARLTKEQYEALPDYVKDDYELDGEQYRPRAEGKLSALKSSLDALDTKFKDTEQRLRDQEAAQAAAIEKAKNEALDHARNKGDVAAIEKRYQEQLEDLKRRSAQELEAAQARAEKLAGHSKAQGRNALLGEIAAQLRIFEDQRKLFNKIIGDRIDIDPDTGSAIFLDDSGGATSLDKAGFVAELARDPSFNRMRQAAANSGGGASGNNGNGTGGALKKFDQYTAAELSAIRKANPSEYERLRDEFKNR